MSTESKREKLELLTNVSKQLKIKYLPDGPKDYGYGPTYKFVVIDEDGNEKTWFVNERQYAELRDLRRGDVINVVMREEKNNEGRTYKRLVVVPALFDEKGELVERAPDVVNDGEARTKYRERRVKLVAEAIEDTLLAKKYLTEKYAQYPQVVSMLDSLFTPDVIQKLATSLFIAEDRRG